MKKIAASLALPSLIASLLVGCVSDDPATPTIDNGAQPEAADDPYGPAPTFRPRNCQDVVDYMPGATDGEYTLYINQDPTYRWKVYCADMDSKPREYLSLDNTADGQNTSRFVPAAGKGSPVVTTYDKVRIDPLSLHVDISDTTFALSTGSAAYESHTLTAMPYAVAMSCGGTASMNINLRGTPFRLETAFPYLGTNPKATTTFASDRRALDMTVEGNCAWVAPSERTQPTDTSNPQVLALAFYPFE